MTTFRKLDASSRRAIADRIARIPAKVKAAAGAVLDAEAEALADEMRRGVPVDQGALRESIRVEVSENGFGRRIRAGGTPETVKRVRKGVKDRHAAGGLGVYDYAAAVEYGHMTPHSENRASKKGRGGFSSQRHVPAQPFFWPAYRRRKKVFLRRLRAAIRKAIENVV